MTATSCFEIRNPSRLVAQTPLSDRMQGQAPTCRAWHGSGLRRAGCPSRARRHPGVTRVAMLKVTQVDISTFTTDDDDEDYDDVLDDKLVPTICG